MLPLAFGGAGNLGCGPSLDVHTRAGGRRSRPGGGPREHHEIAVYEGLITQAEAMGQDDVVRLLRENLEQEQHTRGEVKQHTEQVARETAGAAA